MKTGQQRAWVQKKRKVTHILIPKASLLTHSHSPPFSSVSTHHSQNPILDFLFHSYHIHVRTAYHVQSIPITLKTNQPQTCLFIWL